MTPSNVTLAEANLNTPIKETIESCPKQTKAKPRQSKVMPLDEVVAWYQKKIGTYDKQQWEKTVEQRILSGFTNVPLKNAKLRTELIDVDLVRGSSFPKAKPKHGLLTVIRLAILRFLFLPIYAKWWMHQTSRRIFSFLLFLYGLQVLIWPIYICNVNQKLHSRPVASAVNATGDEYDRQQDEPELVLSFTELLIPIALSLMLSMIHSQIVATASNSHANDKRKCVLQPKNRRKRERSTTKRRKKPMRARNVTTAAGGVDNQKETAVDTRTSTAMEYERMGDVANCDRRTEIVLESLIDSQRNCTVDGVCLQPDSSIAKELRRRNVNWDSPIKSHVIVQRQHQSGWSDDGGRGEEAVVVEVLKPVDPVDQTAGDDDGFESLNGKSSSGEENVNLTNRDAIPGTSDRTAPYNRPKDTLIKTPVADSSDTDEEGDDGESLLTPMNTSHYTEGTTSATEWIGITTNSEECSYSSGELDHNSDSQLECSEGGTIEYDYYTPTVILNPSCGIGDRISCTIWDGREAKKAEMSVLDISSAIIERVEAMPDTCDYVYIGVAFSVVLSLIPPFCRLCEAAINSTDMTEINFFDLPMLLMEKTSFSSRQMLTLMFGHSRWQTTVLVMDFILRLFLTFLFFFLLAVAERTFKQRFLYAKFFSHLTSSRRTRKSELPHFRLNKVRNIKTWLSVRSYLKRRGPQRSVDVIVSAAFILTLLLLAFLSVEWLKDSVQLQSQHTLQALIWSCALGCFILRFMTLGTKINRKYRSVSVLITEQINLYLQIEQKPHNKEELMVSNSVLKLAADLLKELESPFKISGLSANPYLYTTIKVVILSALSGVLSEMLGFKLKLHKIKIK